MPFVEGGIVVDAEPQQQAAPTATQGGFVQGGIEVDPTPEDSYNKVLQYQAAQTDYTPTKQEYLDYLKVSKEKPLLGERPLETVLTAAGQTAVDIAKMPYRLGEAIGQYIEPPEGVMPTEVAAGTAAEIAMQSRLKAEAMARGGYDVALSNLEKLTGKLRSDDDRYEAFLATSEIKRQLARANAPEEQRVPAAQEFLQAYNIPQEAISQPGLEVGGFLADPSSIAFAGGGKAASALAEQLAQRIPRIAAAVQRGGEAVSRAGEAPERGAGALTTAVTGSPAMGQAVQEAISKGTTGVALGEAAGLPITGTMNVPLLGTASRIIGGTKATGATLETLGEAGAISGGQTLTPIQRGLLGAGERIAAAEGASAGARAFGTALARSGIEAPAVGAAKILIPAAGAGAAGGLLSGLTGEEGDAIAAAIGSGFAFGAIDSGFRLAKAASSDALNANRVRRTAVDDLNTRPTEVQFTYIDPTTGAEQLSTIKDAESRAKLYASLDNKQLTKALSEVAGAEAGGAEVIFHGDADAVPASLQGINYAGVAIGPNNIKSGKPTILINVDRAKPETLPHEILHAKITSDVLSQLGSQVIESSVQSPEFQKQFTDFANRYADKLDASGAKVTADRIRTELRDAFDPTQQRAQRIENLKRMTDEFAAYYTQEFLKGKDPKTLLPGRIPSFFELAFNNAKEAVAERFTRQALQNGFDPVARTFYDAKGRRIKIDWMEDAIRNLISPKEGFEPTEQRVDTRKMTQAQQNALILARGYSDLFMTAPDGSIVRPLTKAELAAKTADVANRTIKVIETVPQADRTSVSGLDAKGNPIIEGRISVAEADAVSKSGIFSPSTSRYLIDIATAIRDGTLVEGKYWKVYGPTGKSGVFGESEKLFLPYGISINSKGGVNVKAVDWGKVQARMYKALTKPAYKNLFRTYDQAMSTLKDVYLKNIAEQNAVPSAEALGGGIEGAKKRNFFNEVMGAVPKKGDVMINLPTAGYEAGRKGGSVYQDLRIERIQNANLTGNKIPWSGDMGEQSSYRRTQLNFQPAENIGETQVSTDQNGGYRILSKNGKFRLYGPDGSTVGIFDTEGQAKLKAEKDYATQARLQPKDRQQQYQARDEGRQTAEAGRGYRPERGPQGQGEGGQEPGAVRQAGDVRFMPSSLTARDINAIAAEVGGGDVKGGAKAFGAFMRSMRDKGITLRDVVKSYGITLSSIQRQELPVSTIKKNWPDAPFQEGTKVRPEDAFAQLLGTPEGQKYLNAAEQGVFDEQAADAVVQKFRSFGFHNKLKEQMKTAVEQFYPKAQEIIDAVNTMPTDKFIDYVRNNFKGISYGKVGFWSGQLGRGDIPTFDSRQGKLVYGKEVPVTKQVLMEQKDRLTQLGIKVPAAFKDFAQTLLHHEVWDRLNQSDTEHGPIKEAMLRFMPSDTDYLSAVEKGDTQTAQRMVDEAAKAAGYTVGPVYHGSAARFNQFKRNFLGTATGGQSANEAFFFSTSDRTARNYASYAAEEGPIKELMRKADQAEANGDWDLYDKLIGQAEELDIGRNAQALREQRRQQSKVYDVYLNGRFLEMDAEGKTPAELSSAKAFKQFDGSLTAALKAARRNGYDGVVFRNLDDAPNLSDPSDHYAIFDPNKIKLADPITRDDAGNVIPLSKRFQQTSEDIRYMPSDDEYLTAVKRGNTSAAQDMVDAAAKAAGYTVGPVYHGTPTGGFNVFDKRMRGEASGVSRQAFSFTTNQKAAENYSKRLGDEAVRLDAGLRVVNDAMRRFDDDLAAQEYFSSKGYSSVEYGMLPEFDWGAIDDVPEFIKELRGHAKDLKPINPDLASSFVEAAKVMSSTKAVPEVKRVFLRIPQNAPVFQATPETLGMVMRDFSAEREPTKSGIVELPGNERIYYVADSSQVKLADPVTKDAQGNVIPLSKRFQASSEDIRYMPQPDSSMPGAYSFQGGYRAIPGKTKGSLRLYGPAGSLIGIAASLDEAQRILRRKSK